MAKKKKYHQSVKARMSESRGMMREELAGHNSPKAKGGMISEDMNAMALMPTNVMMKLYPRTQYTDQPDLDDTIIGIDQQMMMDDPSKTRMSGKIPNKY